MADTNTEKSFEEYNQIISEMNTETIKRTSDKLPFNNHEVFKLLLHSFISKLIELSNDTNNELSKNIQMILNALKNCGNTISVLFLLLENLTSKKDEIQRKAILEILKKQEFKMDNVIDLLHKNDTELAITDILKNIEDFIDDFIRKAIKIDLPVAAKNIGSILPALDHKYFLIIDHFHVETKYKLQVLPDFAILYFQVL